MAKEILSVRVDFEILKVMTEAREKYGVSYSEFVRRALLNYIFERYEKDGDFEELIKEVKALRQREHSKFIMRKATLIFNQIKKLKELKKILNDDELREVVEALEQEAEALGVNFKRVKDYMLSELKIYKKGVKHVRGRIKRKK